VETAQVIKKIEIDYPEKNGTITREIIYIGKKSHCR